jgi:F-type H+-transporting ATPase subunit a
MLDLIDEYKLYIEFIYFKEMEEILYKNISSLTQFENKILNILILDEKIINDNYVNGVYYFVNISSIYLFLLIGLIIRYLIDIMIVEIKIIPNKIQYILEIFFILITMMIIGQLNKNSYKYFNYLISLFIMLLIFNILGLIPYIFTVTAQVVITFTLSLGILFSLIIIGFYLNGIKFIIYFFPSGTPILLSPYIFFIEIISFLSKGFSLGIRLTANMFAGHVLLNIISKGMMYFFFFSFLGVKLIFLLIICVVIFFFLLESLISFLQAYVFVILSSIYISEVSKIESH